MVKPGPSARIDIGSLIKNEVDRQRWSYVDFARAINCSRSSLYNIFNSRDISLLRFLKICEVLNYDFLRHLAPPPVGADDDGLPSAHPALTLPIRNGRIDLSALPEPLLAMLRSALGESNS